MLFWVFVYRMVNLVIINYICSCPAPLFIFIINNFEYNKRVQRIIPHVRKSSDFLEDENTIFLIRVNIIIITFKKFQKLF